MGTKGPTMQNTRLTGWALKALGFVVAFLLAVAAEAALLIVINAVSGHSFYPRGLGWIVIPFAAGVGGSATAQTLVPSQLSRITNLSRPSRLFVAGAVSWMLAVVAYVFIAHPFGYYMRDDDWLTVFKWMLAPPILAIVVLRLFKWANRESDTVNSEPVLSQEQLEERKSEAIERWKNRAPASNRDELAQRLSTLSRQLDQTKRTD